MTDEQARRTGGRPAHGAVLPRLPRDDEAEQAVLGAVLLSDTALGALGDMRLRPEHFQTPAHRAIYRAMLNLERRGDPVDSKTIKDELDRAGVLERDAVHPDAVSKAAIDHLAATVPAVGHFRAYAKRVMEMAEWATRCRAALRQLAAIDTRNESEYQAAARELAAFDDQRHTEQLAQPDELALEFLRWYEQPDQHPTIPLPFTELTEALLGGAHPGDTTVVAGWSGMGKSVFGDQWLEHVRDERAMRCCLYPNEMGRIHRTGRMLAARAGVDFARLMRRDLRPHDVRRLLEAAPNLPFAMQPCAGWTEEDIARSLRRHRWDVAMVDRADLVATPASSRSAVEDYDRISRQLAVAAREAGTHLILTVQLNRARDTTAIRPAPVLRDLRGTGAWEQDARNVIFVHREQGEGPGGIARTYEDGHIRLAKASNGAEALVEVLLNTQRMRFVPKPREWDPRIDRPQEEGF